MSAPETRIAQTIMERVSLLLDYDIAWPNVRYTPKAGTPYYRVSILPGQTELRGYNNDNHIGVIQVDVVWPAGDGLINPRKAADDVLHLFRRGTRIGSNPRIDIHRPPYLGPANQTPDRYVIPVSIPYTATTR